MQYVGLLLIAAAVGLRLASRYAAGPSRGVRATSSFRAVHAVPFTAAAVLVAASGVFVLIVGAGLQ